MYWLGFTHGVIVAFFIVVVSILATGTFCMRFVRKLAAANRERMRLAAGPLPRRPSAAAVTSTPAPKGS